MTDRTGEPRRRNLLRAVVDSRLRMPLQSNLVKSAEGDLVIFTTQPRRFAESSRARTRRRRSCPRPGKARPRLIFTPSSANLASAKCLTSCSKPAQI